MTTVLHGLGRLRSFRQVLVLAMQERNIAIVEGIIPFLYCLVVGDSEVQQVLLPVQEVHDSLQRILDRLQGALDVSQPPGDFRHAGRNIPEETS